MTKPMWTPGPWRQTSLDRNGDTMIVRNADPDHHWYCVAHGVQSKNAALIAAAPTLYEALEVALDALSNLADEGIDENTFNEGGIGYEAVQTINNALAQARGEG